MPESDGKLNCITSKERLNHKLLQSLKDQCRGEPYVYTPGYIMIIILMWHPPEWGTAQKDDGLLMDSVPCRQMSRKKVVWFVDFSEGNGISINVLCTNVKTQECEINRPETACYSGNTSLYHTQAVRPQAGNLSSHSSIEEIEMIKVSPRKLLSDTKMYGGYCAWYLALKM